ncbi:hypothetical protein SLS64_013741 [Diaporthe eres]|uniref:Uncharacterized protein n=1 Tax=Diaporthe eres TaxID=83184 RepID=A0ABR1NM71_DIAER
MSISTARLFREIYDQVRDALDYYLGENNPDSAAKFAGTVQLAKGDFEVGISALPEQRQANFFNEAVAKVVLQKAADVAVHGSGEQAALLELTLAMLYGPKMQKPADWISLSVFLDEAAARLMAVRTRIVDFIGEGGQVIDEDARRDFEVFDNLGCFMAGLYAQLQNSSYQLAADLRAAGRFGLRLIADTIRVDKANTILPSAREVLFNVAFAWLAESDGFFVNELKWNENMQEIIYWHERMYGFFCTWQWQDFEYADKISNEIGRFAEALSG